MKIPVPILSVAAVATILTTACGTPPTVYDSGPPPSPASCTQGPGEPPCPGGAGVWRPGAVSKLQRERDLASRAKLVRAGKLAMPPTVDLELVEAAEQDGTPFVFRDEVSSCAWLRSGDGALWSLTGTGGALTRDGERETLFRTTPGARITIGCTMRGVDASIPVGLDPAAANAAGKAGQPYRWRVDCHVFVRAPGSTKTWALPATPTAKGEVLSDATGGCDGLPLPGQTTVPNSCDDGTEIPGYPITPCPSSTGREEEGVR